MALLLFQWVLDTGSRGFDPPIAAASLRTLWALWQCIRPPRAAGHPWSQSVLSHRCWDTAQSNLKDLALWPRQPTCAVSAYKLVTALRQERGVEPIDDRRELHRLKPVRIDGDQPCRVPEARWLGAIAPFNRLCTCVLIGPIMRRALARVSVGKPFWSQDGAFGIAD